MREYTFKKIKKRLVLNYGLGKIRIKIEFQFQKKGDIQTVKIPIKGITPLILGPKTCSRHGCGTRIHQ